MGTPAGKLAEAIQKAVGDDPADQQLMREIVDWVYEESSEWHRQLEAAKNGARENAGVNAADIRRLENQGKDHGSVRASMLRRLKLPDCTRSLGSAHGIMAGSLFGMLTLMPYGKLLAKAQFHCRPSTPTK